MRKTLLLITGLVWASTIIAQSNQIKVKVVDRSDNHPMPGANIEVAGKGGVTTDKDGEFTIPCKDSSLLKISYIGYMTLEKKVNCGADITLALVPKATNLDELEITATSSPDKSQLEQPLSIAKLKEIELKRSTGLFLDDVINTSVPGVYMERRTHSGGQQINIRGYGNGMGFKGVNNNFDSQGLKMYLNGIPITDAEGITMMDDIDFGSVSNAEIVKGPSGTLYGLAIAGVINLQTQKAEKNTTSLSQEVMVGSYGLLRTTTRLAIGEERSSLLVNYGHQLFDGFMPHTASHKDFVNIMGDFGINRKQSLTTYLGFSDSYDERNGELTEAQYDTLDYSGNARYIKNNAHAAVRTFRAGFGHTYRFNRHVSNTSSVFGSAQSIDNSSAGGWTDKYPVNYGIRSSFDKRFELSESISLSGITGIEAQKMNAHTVGYGMSADSTDPQGYNIITATRSNQVITSATTSYFTQWTLHLPKEFSLNAGIGISNMHIELNDRLWGINNNHPGSTTLRKYKTEYTNLVSPNVAVNKTISKISSVYASYSAGYKTPVSSNILISTTGELNTGLKPEKGTQIEVGTKGSIEDNKLFYTVAVFNAKFSNKFTTQTVQNPENTATLYSYIVNGGNLNNTGVEVLLRYDLINSREGFIKLARPFANLTYSNFKYEDYRFERIGESAAGNDSTIVEDYSGNTVAGVSPLVFNAGVDIDTRIGLYGNVNYNYRSEMYYTSDEMNETKPFSLVNAKIGFKRRLGHFEFNAYAGANNITGTQYYYMVFVNQIPDAYIPAPKEINYFGGLNIKYIF